jgi:O-antigen ligase
MTSNQSQPSPRSKNALILTLIVISMVASLAAFSLITGKVRFSPLQIIFWLLPLPFLLLAIVKPEWTLACLIALIFWLPGPIDHFWDVSVSIYESADKVRYLSLLDFIYLGALLFLPRLHRPSYRWIELSIGILLILLIFYSTLNIGWQLGVLESIRMPALSTGTMFFRLFLVYLVIMKFINTRSDYFRLYLGIIVGSVGLIVNSAYKFFTGEMMNLRLVAGTFGNNIFGGLLAVVVVLIFIFIDFTPKIWMKITLIGVQLICFIFILLSGVRIALVIMAFGLLCAFLMKQKNILKTLSRLLFITIILFIFLFSFVRYASSYGPLGSGRAITLMKVVTRQATKEETAYALRTLEPRLVFWNFAFQNLAASPWFGIGPGQWNFERMRGNNIYLVMPNGLVDSISDPHNGYISIAVEYGWPSLALYLIIVILCLAQGWNTIRIAKRKSQQYPWLKQMYFLVGGLLIAALMIQIGEITNSYIRELHTQLFIGTIFFALLRSGTVIKEEIKEIK